VFTAGAEVGMSSQRFPTPLAEEQGLLIETSLVQMRSPLFALRHFRLSPFLSFSSSIMAGHNKWSKIKRLKAVTDVKRGKVFSQLAKEISVAAKHGGGSPDTNARLRSAILAARSQNVPNENIERAIKKGTGELGGAAIEEIVYEAYAPGGTAMMVEVVTDNRNRAAADFRSLLVKNNGTFADAGSVAYMFQRRGEIRVDGAGMSEDQITELALEAGADDVMQDGEEWVLYTATDQLFAVGTVLREKNIQPTSQKLIYHPGSIITIDDPEVAKKVTTLFDALDDYDDTQNVYANFDLTENAASALD
jgi:YebC/PmpR family DNA-binding regulatory protein